MREKWITPKELKGLRNDWMCPLGQIVYDYDGVGSFSAYHEELGLYIIKDMKKLNIYFEAFDFIHDNENKSPFYGPATEYLEDKIGWIRLFGFGGQITPQWIVYINQKITKSQENRILDWCIENNRKYNDWYSKDDIKIPEWCPL